MRPDYKRHAVIKTAKQESSQPDSPARFSAASLWQRKCSILEEELEIRTQQKELIQRQLAAVQSRKELNKKSNTIQTQPILSVPYDDGPKNEKSNTYKLKRLLKEELDKHKQLEFIIENQRREIKKLTTVRRGSISANNTQEKEEKQPTTAPTCTTTLISNSSGENLIEMRYKLIKSRQNQLKLARLLEKWKNKACALEKQLQSVDEGSTPRSESIGNFPSKVDNATEEKRAKESKKVKDEGPKHGIVRISRTDKNSSSLHCCMHEGCQRMTKAYCKCDPEFWRCKAHFLRHIKKETLSEHARMQRHQAIMGDLSNDLVSTGGGITCFDTVEHEQPQDEVAEQCYSGRDHETSQAISEIRNNIQNEKGIDFPASILLYPSKAATEDAETKENFVLDRYDDAEFKQ